MYLALGQCALGTWYQYYVLLNCVLYPLSWNNSISTGRINSILCIVYWGTYNIKFVLGEDKYSILVEGMSGILTTEILS